MDDTKLQNRKRVLLGIVRDPKGRVLIIKRTTPENADRGQRLTWIFPGGETTEEADPQVELPKEILAKGGCVVEVVKKISERDYPKPFVHLEYYECKISRPASAVVESTHKVEQIKWLDPANLKKFFTTDIDPKVAQYLGV